VKKYWVLVNWDSNRFFYPVANHLELLCYRSASVLRARSQLSKDSNCSHRTTKNLPLEGPSNPGAPRARCFWKNSGAIRSQRGKSKWDDVLALKVTRCRTVDTVSNRIRLFVAQVFDALWRAGDYLEGRFRARLPSDDGITFKYRDFSSRYRSLFSIRFLR